MGVNFSLDISTLQMKIKSGACFNSFLESFKLISICNLTLWAVFLHLANLNEKFPAIRKTRCCYQTEKGHRCTETEWQTNKQGC